MPFQINPSGLVVGSQNALNQALSVNDYSDIDSVQKWLSSLSTDLGSVWASAIAASGVIGPWDLGTIAWQNDATASPPPSAQTLQADLLDAISVGQKMVNFPKTIMQATSIQNAAANIKQLQQMLGELATLRSGASGDQQTIAQLQGQVTQLQQQLQQQQQQQQQTKQQLVQTQQQGYSGGALVATGAGAGVVGFIAGLMMSKSRT
jgi:ElaB/YqjD/DUF883 family membrane-anchored ribosome-binding protein